MRKRKEKKKRRVDTKGKQQNVRKKKKSSKRHRAPLLQELRKGTSSQCRQQVRRLQSQGMPVSPHVAAVPGRRGRTVDVAHELLAATNALQLNVDVLHGRLELEHLSLDEVQVFAFGHLFPVVRLRSRQPAKLDASLLGGDEV